MTNTNETIADIIAEMRDWLGDANGYDLRSLADRLEAAWKRECATAEKSLVVGDAAKLREALEMMNTLFEQGAICTSSANSAEEMEQIEELYRKTKAALAEPPRNCDKYSHDEARAVAKDYIARMPVAATEGAVS